MKNKITLLFACSMFCASDEIPEGDTLTALNCVLKHRYLECLDPAANQAARKEYIAAKAEYDKITPESIEALKRAITESAGAKNELKECIQKNFPGVYNDDQINSIAEEWIQIKPYDYIKKNFTPSNLLEKFLDKVYKSNSEDNLVYALVYAFYQANEQFYKHFRKNGYDNIPYSPAYLKSYNRFVEAEKRYKTIQEIAPSFQEIAALRASCSSVKK